MGRGRVIGIDIEIRPHNRRAIEAHEMKPLITLIEGSSIDPAVVASVRALIAPGETVLVLLDSNHTKAHVLAELEAYGPLVTPGSYIVATDGIMKEVAGAPRTEPDWNWNNPLDAAREFAAKHPEFSLEEPDVPLQRRRRHRARHLLAPRLSQRGSESCSAERVTASSRRRRRRSSSSRRWALDAGDRRDRVSAGAPGSHAGTRRRAGLGGL